MTFPGAHFSDATGKDASRLEVPRLSTLDRSLGRLSRGTGRPAPSTTAARELDAYYSFFWWRPRPRESERTGRATMGNCVQPKKATAEAPAPANAGAGAPERQALRQITMTEVQVWVFRHFSAPCRPSCCVRVCVLLTCATYQARGRDAEATWLIVNGRVFEVGEWFLSHPGGPDAIRRSNNSDVTEGFTALHDQSAWSKLEEFCIGTPPLGHPLDVLQHEIQSLTQAHLRSLLSISVFVDCI
jgi:hypothetical protein